MRILVSSCLAGHEVRYDGRARTSPAVEALIARSESSHLCPEVAGGLPVPRDAAELRPGSDGRVLTTAGADVTEAYERGAQLMVEHAREFDPDLVILMDRSPACGSGRIYDGTFTGNLTAGDGIAARALAEARFPVFAASELERIMVSPEHPLTIVLGSGFSPVAHAVTAEERIPYEEILPLQRGGSVPGHGSELIRGTFGGVPVLVYTGRIHGYQGYSAYETTALIRDAHARGSRTVILTNASGGVSPAARAGTPLIITDHLNLTGDNPLIAPEPAAPDGVFVDMSDAYSPLLRTIAAAVMGEKDQPFTTGVYASVHGPSYETPAEARMIASLGADCVGMSTVHETIQARALGMSVLGISLVTNVSGAASAHDDVLDVGMRSGHGLVSVLEGIGTSLSL